jgi:hypothetical protein
MPPKRLDNLLNPAADGDLGKLVRRARDMGRLAQILRDALPAEAAAGVLEANLRDDGVLVVLAPTSAWAARLRFEADSMLQTVRATGARVSGCKVRVYRDAPTPAVRDE